MYNLYAQPLHFGVDIQIIVMEWALCKPGYLNMYYKQVEAAILLKMPLASGAGGGGGGAHANASKLPFQLPFLCEAWVCAFSL